MLTSTQLGDLVAILGATIKKFGGYNQQVCCFFKNQKGLNQMPPSSGIQSQGRASFNFSQKSW
jgi:hypothetical protein